MKLRQLSLRETLTFWIVFDGANAIGGAINGSYIFTGCCIGLGIILIYLRENFS